LAAKIQKNNIQNCISAKMYIKYFSSGVFLQNITVLLVSATRRVVGGQSRKMAKPIFGRGVGGAV